jgi:histidinol-phosphate aminotransferase
MSTSTDGLAHHGDAELAAGLLDFAVNVRRAEPPPWLRTVLAASLDRLASYPDDHDARGAVAERHDRTIAEVLLTAGAAEAFVLLAQALRPRHAVVVHPQFTEPEAALRAAGHEVERLVLDVADGFRLDPARVPVDADLVVIGNPTNPTSVLHPAATLRALARPGRTLVIDEAFMDAVPGEPESLAAERDLTGLVVIRSLTKTWALAGLRIGYALGDPGVLDQLRRVQPLWAVSTPALAAARACSAPTAVLEAARAASSAVLHRDYLLAALERLPAVTIAGMPRAPFVLIHLAGADRIRLALRTRGVAVRRGDTFPGLGRDWLRVAVRPPELTDHLITALSDVLTADAAPPATRFHPSQPTIEPT